MKTNVTFFCLKEKSMKTFKFFLSMLFLICWSCKNAGDIQPLVDMESVIEIQISESDDEWPVLFDDEGNVVLDWAVKLKLKPQDDETYLPTRDPDIKALLLKHGLHFKQSWWLPTTNPELLLYYDLRGRGTMDEKSRENAINDFLATGKFEDEVFDYGYAHTTN